MRKEIKEIDREELTLMSESMSVGRLDGRLPRLLAGYSLED